MTHPRAKGLVEASIEMLRQRGVAVTPADIPGLYDVGGYGELTVGQLVDVARRASETTLIRFRDL